jgi:hypothetical protein
MDDDFGFCVVSFALRVVQGEKLLPPIARGVALIRSKNRKRRML